MPSPGHHHHHRCLANYKPICQPITYQPLPAPKVTSIYAAKLGSTAGAISRRCHVTGASSAYSQFATFAAYSLLIWFGGYEVHYGRAGWEGEGSPLPCGTGAAIEAWPL